MRYQREKFRVTGRGCSKQCNGKLIYGAGFKDVLKDIFGKVKKGVKIAAPVLKDIAKGVFKFAKDSGLLEAGVKAGTKALTDKVLSDNPNTFGKILEGEKLSENQKRNRKLAGNVSSGLSDAALKALNSLVEVKETST